MATSNGKGEKASKFETLKLLEKCRTERDDAMHRENVLREKLRQYESRIRSTEAVRQKLKTLTTDNKELRKQVKALRTEIGLECSPKFIGKTTKDIIDDLHEKDRECSSLVEKTGKLNLSIDVLTSEVANAVTAKALLEDQVQTLQQNLKDMTNNQRRLLKLWDDKKVQREQLALPAIAQKPVQKPFVHKAVQTEMSINSSQTLPVNAFETKPFSLDHGKTVLDKHSFPTYGNGYLHDKKAFMHDETKGIKNRLDSLTDIH
ncbi:CAP-Gly domain-containing linker protein 1 [Clinocottus analis]|uniref:CAP-Gly domain-containing linker protein 1 n=1 Tax=Clinocottus analis TaxID=304258 RepID=UPI0035BF4CB6